MATAEKLPESPPYEEALLTAKNLANKLGKTKSTVLKWARDGLIPCRKIGKASIWFVESEVRAAMKNWDKKA